MADATEVLDADRLLAEAADATGLDDFGDPAFREGLDLLSLSLREEAQLSDLGVTALQAQIHGQLVNRLRVVDWIGAHPAVLEAPQARPLVIIGLPRTGTTLLSYLFDQDPANRSLLRWEFNQCIPPPEADALHSDPRLTEATLGLEMLDAINPEFKAIHYEAPDGPTEDVAVLAQDFRSWMWECVANVPSYGQWLHGCDISSAYRWLHTVTAVLQSRAPGRWSLKTPQHCLHLDELFATWPDACVVMTHRDPVKAVPSLVSLIRSLSGTFSDADHGAYIAHHWTANTALAVERVMTWRDEHGGARIVDLPYAELVADPVAAVRRVYAHFGDDLSTEAETAMRAYAAANPKDRFGAHRYTLDELGLDAGALREHFARYVERYDVPLEA
ncbi:MAG: sulfotransferase [Acidimicrobiales bacterium]